MTLSLCGHQAMSSTGAVWPQTIGTFLSTRPVWRTQRASEGGALALLTQSHLPTPLQRVTEGKVVGSLGGGEGPGVGGFGALPQSQSCLGNSEGWPQVAQDGHAGWSCPSVRPWPSSCQLHLSFSYVSWGLVPPPSPHPKFFHGMTGQGPQRETG